MFAETCLSKGTGSTLKRRKFPKHYATLLDSFTAQCLHIYTKGTYTRPQTWKTLPIDTKVAPESPRRESNAPKVSQSDLRVRSK